MSEEENTFRDQALEKLKTTVNEKDTEYQQFQQMYPYVKKAIEAYGDRIEQFSWYNNSASFGFEKYGHEAPIGFLTYLEKIGLKIKTVGRDSGSRHFEVEVEGVNDIGSN